ncbi:PH domain-containing protein [Bacillus paralicheniformis]|uniref:PH domain-containing protein n=1 Tax=Bacillus paralicheniformis TaxID=1648923 RepID=UPI002243996E|nr:PH domain-containing protein [Bacillus paralicheniformis]MEC1023711.1 PH domain-containing protein [Bacillus paralicheniformis]MEC1027840.1 PH domain-containing protein [Bacillus paralicheniformis]MEC1035483.1 PH domain-containing protein [Bacillus paralicheniformis]MEC1052257.1 PH domain-containing protein [Bacillus paralicheniformis]MEC1059552.1 PH domain-containing protein [Bacillus paralicheniformis]
MMSEPRRMHPAAVILNFIKGLVETVKNFIIPFGVVLFLNQSHTVKMLAIAAAVLFFIALVVTSIIKWSKFTYRIEEDELRIEEGLINKKKRYIPIERIQTINTSAGLIQQMFKLVKLQVETASGGTEAEVSLVAITQAEAERIQQALFERKKAAEGTGADVTDPLAETAEDAEETAEEPEMMYKMTGQELLTAASTSSGIGVIISGVFAFFTQVDDFFDLDWLYDRFAFLNSAGAAVIALAAFVALFIAWLLSIVGMLLKYANFTVVRKEKEIVISRGLIEKHQITIPLQRIQAIKIKESLIRQPFGLAAVTIVSAGGNVLEEDKSAVLFPIISKKMIKQRLGEFIPDYAPEDDLNRLPKRALRRYLLRASWPVLAVVPLSILFPPWGYLSAVLIPFYWIIGCLSYRDAGWKISGSKIIMSSRFIGRTTAVIQRRRMQVFEVSRSYFQRRRQLVSIHTSTKSSALMEKFSVADVEEKDSDDIFAWYSYEKRVNG